MKWGSVCATVLLCFGRWFDLKASFLSIASSCAWSEGWCVLLYLIGYFGRRFELKVSVSLASIALQVILFWRHFMETCSQLCFEDNQDRFLAICCFCFEDKSIEFIAIFFWRPTNRPTDLGIEAPSRSLKNGNAVNSGYSQMPKNSACTSLCPNM